MFRTLYSKLLTFFLILSLGGILLVGVAIYFGVQETFQEYLINKREGQIKQVVMELENTYELEGDITVEPLWMMLHHYGFQEQLFFHVFNRNGELIIDTAQMNNGMGQHMMSSPPMGSVNIESDIFDYIEHPLVVNGEQIGVVKAFFPSAFLQGDVDFLTQFNKYLIGAVIIMIIVSLILSFIFSKRLTTGLKGIANATGALRNHQLDIQVKADSKVEEIDELAKGINELAASLKEGERLRKQFTSDLAHELRTPLTTLRSQLESIQDGIFYPTKERLDQCHHELMRLVRLVNEMEELHAAENPRIRLNLEQHNAKETIHSLYDRFQPMFKQKGINLKIKVDEDIQIRADRDRFIQIMTNLLNNALKFTESSGEVQVLVEQIGEGVYISVKDNGIGMTEEELNHIFERFYRGEKSRNRKTGGLGIGLSIVKALMDAHRGEIYVDSKKGRGTTVTIFFY
ncbi:integral membrane sensor signal transduction histidine kinase [Evansella cellulosilytica DSM 2522]|uniref:histidine kinase n=1 Tax=Evansella cellulosilytica (strain ATCC 21833 / DSM 2522 / FERM P-1141 / JCM 9156 / N-4) TaxID=649639 RepID=E6TYW6_EVAC2|nr:integral membrane sensor signal transduction histidine kinase [Evansella cellulosilytica DSM 2522]